MVRTRLFDSLRNCSIQFKSTMENKIKIETSFYSIKIFINNLMHVYIKIKDLHGIQSWRDRKDKWCIEYIMKNNIIRSEYENEELFIEIITELAKLEFN